MPAGPPSLEVMMFDLLDDEVLHIDLVPLVVDDAVEVVEDDTLGKIFLRLLGFSDWVFGTCVTNINGPVLLFVGGFGCTMMKDGWFDVVVATVEGIMKGDGTICIGMLGCCIGG